MGYMRHHAIVVTSWVDEDAITSIRATFEDVHTRAKSIFQWVSEISPATTNGYRSFFIPPDGSKEGWDRSDEGDRQRDAFIRYIDGLRYGDGSTPFDWVEVQFADDDGVTRVTRDSDHYRHPLAEREARSPSPESSGTPEGLAG